MKKNEKELLTAWLSTSMIKKIIEQYTLYYNLRNMIHGIENAFIRLGKNPNCCKQILVENISEINKCLDLVPDCYKQIPEYLLKEIFKTQNDDIGVYLPDDLAREARVTIRWEFGNVKYERAERCKLKGFVFRAEDRDILQAILNENKLDQSLILEPDKLEVTARN